MEAFGLLHFPTAVFPEQEPGMMWMFETLEVGGKAIADEKALFMDFPLQNDPTLGKSRYGLLFVRKGFGVPG